LPNFTNCLIVAFNGTVHCSSSPAGFQGGRLVVDFAGSHEKGRRFVSWAECRPVAQRRWVRAHTLTGANEGNEEDRIMAGQNHWRIDQRKFAPVERRITQHEFLDLNRSKRRERRRETESVNRELNGESAEGVEKAKMQVSTSHNCFPASTDAEVMLQEVRMRQL